MRARAARVLETVGCDAFVASDPFTVDLAHGLRRRRDLGAESVRGRAARGRPRGRLRRRGRERGRGARARGQRLRGRRLRGLHGRARSTCSPRAGGALASLGLRGRVAVEDGALPVPGARAPCRPTPTRCACCARSRTTTRSRASAPPSASATPGRRPRARPLRSGVSELEAWGEVADRDADRGRRAALAALRLRDRRAHRGRSAARPARARCATATSRSSTSCRALAGYFGDSCSTIARRRRAGRGALGARPLQRGARARHSRRSRPASSPATSTRIARAGLDYPHHTGHGVGVAPHEEPRIVPGGETVLAPGMVVALEPGTYPGPVGHARRAPGARHRDGLRSPERARHLTLTLN